MGLILEGGIIYTSGRNLENRFIFKDGEIVGIGNTASIYQQELREKYKEYGEVNLDNLCTIEKRLAISKEIANNQHFLHWELEFADVFYDNGGFDLVIGNPPWVKLEWSEENVLSENNPIFAIRKLSASDAARYRSNELQNKIVYNAYMQEYVNMTGNQLFLNSIVNYSDLRGQQTDLYKCFVPLSWQIANSEGCSSLIHPNSIYDDSNGAYLRKKLWFKVKYRFHFINELLLFKDVAHAKTYSLNIYQNGKNTINISMIANLFHPSAIDDCYDNNCQYELKGIKDENDNWSITGNPSRIVNIDENIVKLLAKTFSNTESIENAKLVPIHCITILNVIEKISESTSLKEETERFSTVCWDDTNAQINGIIKHRNIDEIVNQINLEILSGPNIFNANPLYKTARKKCVEKGDYDIVDLLNISDEHLNRGKVIIANNQLFIDRMPQTSWGKKYNECYKLLFRKMLNLKQERTLICSLLPNGVTHASTCFGITLKDVNKLVSFGGYCSSLVYDYFIKTVGKDSLNIDSLGNLPLIETKFDKYISNRFLLLNCLTKHYNDIYKNIYYNMDDSFVKNDDRLNNIKFEKKLEWTWDVPLRTNYERRQAMLEIDVLVAMALELSLDDLINIYRIQFPIMQQYEKETYYDKNGRIVFTTNRGLVGVGFSRSEFEPLKNAKAGEVFTRTILDDTLPGGPIERTIEYVAPFDKCDRVEDYKLAWKVFSERFKN